MTCSTYDYSLIMLVLVFVVPVNKLDFGSSERYEFAPNYFQTNSKRRAVDELAFWR